MYLNWITKEIEKEFEGVELQVLAETVSPGIVRIDTNVKIKACCNGNQYEYISLPDKAIATEIRKNVYDRIDAHIEQIERKLQAMKEISKDLRRELRDANKE